MYAPKIMPDQLSALYSEFLEGGYDCVDRIVLNAYFRMGVTGGGFRTWWRELYGSDDNLDDNHLMRMAGRFSRRLRAWGKANGVPVVYCSPGDDKHKMAEEYQASHQMKPGLFLVLVAKAPALVWEAQMTGTGKLGQLVPKEPWPYVNHYSFHILARPRLGACDDQDERASAFRRAGDSQWARICGSPGAKGGNRIYQTGELLHGRERRNGVGEGRRHLVSARDRRAPAPTLRALDYSTCLCFALDLEEQEKSTFQYPYSVFQMEYSRNLLFRSGRQMEEIFQALIDRKRAPLDLDRIKTIFGDKNRPHYDTRKKNPTRWGVVVETPTYDLTVFKVHYGKMTLKIYTKGARVLRVEVIVHNTKEYRWGRSLPCFGEIVTRLHGILERFLNAVGCLGACFVADDTLEDLPLPASVGQTKVGGIDFNKPRMRQVAEAVLALSTSPTSPAGFTASNLAQKVRKMSGHAEADYGPRRAAYDIKKLRAKGMLRKIGTSRRYESMPEGLRAIAALLVLREKVIRPLLAASQRPESTSKPNHPTPVDHHYEHLQAGMRDLFTALGMVA